MADNTPFLINRIPGAWPTNPEIAYIGTPTTLNDGDALSYVALRSRWENTNGAVKVNLNPTQWNDIFLPATNLRPGASPPSFTTFLGGVYGFSFVNGNSDELHGATEIPHDYEEGTDLHVHIHWSPTNTNTGLCVFNFEYTIANNGSVFPGTNTLIPVGQAGAGVAYTHQYFELGQISGAGLLIGTIIAFRLVRPAGDPFTGDAFVHSVGIHYKVNTLGSNSETAK